MLNTVKKIIECIETISNKDMLDSKKYLTKVDDYLLDNQSVSAISVDGWKLLTRGSEKFVFFNKKFDFLVKLAHRSSYASVSSEVFVYKRILQNLPEEILDHFPKIYLYDSIRDWEFSLVERINAQECNNSTNSVYKKAAKLLSQHKILKDSRIELYSRNLLVKDGKFWFCDLG